MKLMMTNKNNKRLLVGMIMVLGIACANKGTDDSQGTNPLSSPKAGEYHKFARVPGSTPGGQPLPLSGGVIANETIVVKDSSAELKNYPEVYFPGTEELGEGEMRIVCIGSGNPHLRIGQAATGWAVELGNGEKFVFDIGGGTVGNLWSLGSSPAEWDKLFVSHLHLDHVGGILPMYDAMGWSRNLPLQVWGPSGATEENGTAAFVENIVKASSWHNESKTGVGPSEGMEMIAHEFDYYDFTEENPSQLVYDENGVKVYSFPVIHTIAGSVAYRLEWNGLSMVFSGDAEPSTLMIDQSRGVDVLIHETFISAESFAEKNNVPLEVAVNVVEGAHTTVGALGQILDEAKPTLGVAHHYSLDDDLIDPFFRDIAPVYDGPVAIAQDMMVINVTPEQIVTRMASPDLLVWPEEAPELEKEPVIGERSDQNRPEWITETRLERN